MVLYASNGLLMKCLFVQVSLDFALASVIICCRFMFLCSICLIFVFRVCCILFCLFASLSGLFLCLFICLFVCLFVYLFFFCVILFCFRFAYVFVSLFVCLFPKQVSDRWGSGALKACQGAAGLLGVPSA